MIDIEKNWTEIKGELFPTQRDGMNKLIDYLEKKTDFKTAVASTKFHLSVPGGLVQHSLNVLKYARLVNKELNLNITDDSLVIVSLLHDLCKVNYYVKGWEWDKEIKEATGKWVKKDTWKVEDQLPLGHGEKSVILAVRFIPLSANEMTAMRWHMSWSDLAVHFNYPSGFPFRETLDKNPLAKLLAIADQLAEFSESQDGTEEKK